MKVIKLCQISEVAQTRSQAVVCPIKPYKCLHYWQSHLHELCVSSNYISIYSITI